MENLYFCEMETIYNLGIYFYGLGIRLLAFFKNEKAQKWRNGRKDIFEKLAQIEKNAIWIHAASLGEFEQGRPLIEAIKKQYPKERILLTFFSPSGYEIRKNYALADTVTYLPMDTKRNARQFLELCAPKLAIFIKYEFWHHYITELHVRKIPVYSVSAVFRANQIYFQWYGGWFRQILMRFDHIFVQNKTSLELLERFELGEKASLTGDTRVDRVWDIKENAQTFPLIDAFLLGEKALICGSTWAIDEAMIVAFIKKNSPLPFKIILAPHEIGEQHVKATMANLEKITKVVRYSAAENADLAAASVLVIDNVGMLSALYRYGKMAYIGGGLGKGLHNTLEPIAFGLPVIFGDKKYQKFEEAIWLAKNRGGFAIGDAAAFEAIILKLLDADFYEKARTKALLYVTENRGATVQTLEAIF